MSQKRIEPRRDEVHLWFTTAEEIDDPDLLEAYQSLLAPKERSQQKRFVFPRHRHQYLVARALVRTTLSRYVDVEPRDWIFSTNKHGRPEISRPLGVPPLRFNLSHTNGLMVCGVVLDREIGVDVENRSRRIQNMAIVDRFFAPQEVRDIRLLPADEQKIRFFDYWTLKESYIKARGMGLAIPLSKFAFYVATNQPLALSIDPELEDDPASWRFSLLRPTDHHTAAVAVERRSGPQLPLLSYRIVPMAKEQPLTIEQIASTDRSYRGFAFRS